MIIKVHEKPGIDELTGIINEAISKRAFLVIIACCRIKYRGRATSRLGSGDRTIIIKTDGSFLIHQDYNLEPVNWQPPNCNFKIKTENGIIFIKGIRRNPDESLEVEIHKAYMASYHRGKDIKTLELAGYEEDMRDLIFKSPQMIESGFKPTSKEYAVTGGFIDILGKDKDGRLVVLELKSRRAGINAVKQLKRYFEDFIGHKDHVRGILVAPSITEDACRLLKKYGLEFKKMEPPGDLVKSSTLTLDHFNRVRG